MKILALDLATKTGWARNDEPWVWGTWDLSVNHRESPGMRYLRLNQALKALGQGIDLVVYEQPHHRGAAATRVTLGLAAHVESWCAEHGIEHTAVHSSELKRHATGKGNAKKAAMVEAARHLVAGEVEDDNQADAICLLDYAIRAF